MFIIVALLVVWKNNFIFAFELMLIYMYVGVDFTILCTYLCNIPLIISVRILMMNNNSAMDRPLVTVLVAVWNTAEYLPQCLDSLRRQTLAEVQVVCVDDASTDGSLQVLRSYAALDSRIEVVALAENRGQAHARNVGLRQARGAYVCFLDSDDWMSADCLEQAVRVFRQHPDTGSVLFHTLYYYSEARQEEFSMPAFEVLSGEEAFTKSLTWQIHGVYMVRADIHRQFPYDESAHAFSDDNTTRLHYLASPEVRTCAGTYYYRQRATSVSHKFCLRRFDYLLANLSMKRQLQALAVCSDVLNLYETHRWLNLIDMYMLWFKHGHELTAEDRRKALCMIKDCWQTIDAQCLPKALSHKFGYAHCTGHWHLFRAQEDLYFALRRMVGRL